MFNAALCEQAETILSACKQKGLKIATAESCTGGLLAALFTEIPGSSVAFEGGVVSYSNPLKKKLLGVSAETLDKHGAVSSHVAEEMAKGVQKISGSDIAISITGIAGPDGGTKEKPVGLVYIGYVFGSHAHSEKHQFKGDRQAVRMQSVQRVLDILREKLSRSSSASS